jgi:hypothetical protein
MTKKKPLFKSIKVSKDFYYVPNPYGRKGKPNFMRSVVRGLENFLSSPFNKK